MARPHEQVEVKLNCSFEVRGGSLRAIVGKPSSLIGIPYDRPVVGYGGKNINTLRLWAAAAPDYFDFRSSAAAISSARWPRRSTAESITRVLYPDDSTSMGQGLRFVQEYFLVACSLADIVRRFRASNTDWNTFRKKSPSSSTTRIRPCAVPELMRILLDEAHLGWDQAWDITQRDAGLHESHAAARSTGEMAGRLVRDGAAAPSGNHLRNQPASAGRCPDAIPGDEGTRCRA